MLIRQIIDRDPQRHLQTKDAHTDTQTNIPTHTHDTGRHHTGTHTQRQTHILRHTHTHMQTDIRHTDNTHTHKTHTNTQATDTHTQIHTHALR